MELTVEKRDGVHFISPHGEMVTGEGEQRFKDELNRASAGGERRVIIDFTNVPYIDSSVLGQLVHGYTILKKDGGTLKLVNPSRRVMDLLKLTRLNTIFEIFDTREAAVSSWKRNSSKNS